MATDFLKDRGKPWEHDPGPAPSSRLARLFAETPNYRALGKALVGREAFRWHFGPMFYRGRLADGAVRVMVIGQEGAQDESLGHRSFVGGTGARMQPSSIRSSVSTKGASCSRSRSVPSRPSSSIATRSSTTSVSATICG
jgi:hypothetical protein